MTSKERQQLLKKIQKTTKKAAKNSAAAEKVLLQTGVYTPNGNLKKAFR